MKEIRNQAGQLMQEINDEGKVVRYSDISGKEKVPATELCELCLRHGSDKCGNGYTEFYSRHFEPIKTEVKKVLEIGVSAGGSIKMWHDYFKNALIYGVDAYPDNCKGILPEKATELSNDRTIIRLFDQSKVEDVEKFESTFGRDFDLICDDGSHKQRDQQMCFGILFKLLKPGRFYICEDLVAADAIYANPALRWDPTDMVHNDSTATFFANAIKGIYASQYIVTDQLEYLRQNIEWIKFLFGCSSGEPHANPFQWGGPITVLIKKKDV